MFSFKQKKLVELLRYNNVLQKNKKRIAKHYNKYSFLSEKTKQEIQEIITNAKKIISNDLLPIIRNLNEPLEGNIFMFHNTIEYTNEFFDKQVNIILSTKNENINNILEIGFNAGFSTLLMLLTNKNLKITCVDICEHIYTKLCFQKLQDIFGNRLELLPGSSIEIVPTLIGKKYDLIHIDGCHLVNIAELDIIHSLKLCKSGTLIIMDDVVMPELHNLWYKYVTNYNLQEIKKGNFINTKYHDIKIYP
jgi:predicted O-methyltransferase YrrM